MRHLAFALIVAVTLGACASMSPAPARTSVSVSWSVFYDSLSPYGDWVWFSPHGWVWIPSGMDVAWQPYSYGRWVYTVDGWTWISYWQWGWAPFHYGRWAWEPHWGWYWVPDTLWGPAWVAWRYGDGYVGWAPLPPGATWHGGVGLTLGHTRMRPSSWMFVRQREFVDHNVRSRIIPPESRQHILGRTRDVTHYEPGQERQVIERGLPPDQIRQGAGVEIPRYRIEDVQKPAPPRDAIDRDAVRIYRPPITRQEAPEEVRGTRSRATPPGKAEPPKPAKPGKSAKSTRPPGE